MSKSLEVFILKKKYIIFSFTVFGEKHLYDKLLRIEENNGLLQSIDFDCSSGLKKIKVQALIPENNAICFGSKKVTPLKQNFVSSDF